MIQALLLVAALTWGASLAHAQGENAKPDARGTVVQKYLAAMDASQFGRAHEAAQQLTQDAPRDSMAWYRRARAAAGAKAWDDAATALAKAKDLDPKMSFTQNPVRVQELEARIAEGLKLTQRPPEVVVAEKSAAAAGSVGAAVTTQTTPPPAAEPAAVAAAGPIAEAASAGAEATSALNAAQAAVGHPAQPTPVVANRPPLAAIAVSAEPYELPWWDPLPVRLLCGVLLLAMLGLAGLALVLRQMSAGNARFQAFLDHISDMEKEHGQLHDLADVYEGMARVQREMHQLVKHMEEKGLTESEIYAEMKLLQPTLDRNIGLAPLRELELRGMDANTTTAEEVTKRVLEMHRKGRYTMRVPA